MDPNDLNGNFINPDYATPEQVAQMRAYAEMLQKGATADTSKSWTGVLAQALMGLGGARSMGNANQMQRQILQQGSNAIQGVGQVNPAAGVITGQNPTMPQASNIPASGGNNALKAAILMQESGNNSNIGNSSAGAIGPGQIMPNTFASVARPGENINNPNDNRAVSARLLDQYEQKYGGDPARAAVAYFSGPGNVAPPGSPTPWISDRRDTNGKSVSSYVADVTRRMGGGGQQMAQNNPMATFMMTPGIPPELRQRVMDLNTPTPAEDVAGRPGVRLGTMGPAVGVGNAPNFTPGFRAPATVGPDGGISTTIANPAPGAGGVPTARDQLGGLQKTGQEFAQSSAANAAVRGGITSDVQAAQAAIPIMQNLDMMANDIEKHGDNMNFGPSADFMTKLKGIVANHAPSLMSPAEIEGLAAQNTMRKQTALLSAAISKSIGNTDLSRLQGDASVPGEHNSREGNLAIIDMLKQQVGLNSRFVMENYKNYGTPGFDPIAAKARFFKENPIINPLTKHPITVDLAEGEKTSSSQINYKKLSDEELKKRLNIK